MPKTSTTTVTETKPTDAPVRGRLAISLPAPIADRVRAHCDAEHLSVSEYIRALIRADLASNPLPHAAE
jgi:hypothetical protein